MKGEIYKLVLFGCGHSGAKAANFGYFRYYAEMLKEKNTFGISLGDLFENAIPGGKSEMMLEQHMSPEEQIEQVENLFRPVKHKFIAACTSNHSERTYKQTGLNMDRMLWKALGRTHIFHDLEGTVMFRGKRIAYAHGLGHGSNEWGDARKLLAVYPTVDIIALSHRHEMAVKWFGNFEVDRRGKKVPRWVMFARTGGLMEWARYARRELYTPQRPGFTVLYFLPDGSVRADTNGIPEDVVKKYQTLDRSWNWR